MSIIEAKMVTDPAGVVSPTMGLDCKPIGVEWQKWTIRKHSRTGTGGSPTAAAAAGWLVMSCLVISRRMGDVRIVGLNSLGGGSLGWSAGNGASVRVQPFFNCRKLQAGVANRAEIVVYLGEGKTGVKFAQVKLMAYA